MVDIAGSDPSLPLRPNARNEVSHNLCTHSIMAKAWELFNAVLRSLFVSTPAFNVNDITEKDHFGRFLNVLSHSCQLHSDE